jgi:hypothetical protein
VKQGILKDNDDETAPVQLQCQIYVHTLLFQID